MNRSTPRRLSCLLVLSLSIVALAAEEVDTEIIKRFEFFSQMDVIQNLDLAQQLSADEAPEEANP